MEQDRHPGERRGPFSGLKQREKLERPATIVPQGGPEAGSL